MWVSKSKIWLLTWWRWVGVQHVNSTPTTHHTRSQRNPPLILWAWTLNIYRNNFHSHGSNIIILLYIATARRRVPNTRIIIGACLMVINTDIGIYICHFYSNMGTYKHISFFIHPRRGIYESTFFFSQRLSFFFLTLCTFITRY